ncbi:MAG: biopolymer transporter ExbD [Planctomycetales bacterium]|nr:biopolymer transporter ExbD [Planctomycetales bacterium]
MRFPHYGRSRSIEFNVTPLIDIIFLLIIFFLVSSHLAQQETQLELPLPVAASGHEATGRKSPRVTINLLSDGRLFLGSDEVVADELPRRLQVEREQTSEAIEVRIRADRHIEYQHVEPLLLACVQAGVWNVSFAVLEESVVK